MHLGLGRYWGEEKINERLPLAVWFFLRDGGDCNGSLCDLGCWLQSGRRGDGLGKPELPISRIRSSPRVREDRVPASVALQGGCPSHRPGQEMLLAGDRVALPTVGQLCLVDG